MALVLLYLIVSNACRDIISSAWYITNFYLAILHTVAFNFAISLVSHKNPDRRHRRIQHPRYPFLHRH